MNAIVIVAVLLGAQLVWSVAVVVDLTDGNVAVVSMVVAIEFVLLVRMICKPARIWTWCCLQGRQSSLCLVDLKLTRNSRVRGGTLRWSCKIVVARFQPIVFRVFDAEIINSTSQRSA